VRVERVRRRGLVPLLIGALVVAALVAVVVAVAGGGSSRSSSSAAGPNGAPTLDIGGQPAALSVGPTGNLWASLSGAGEIVRVGAATERARRFAVGGHPGAIAAARDGLWVAGSAAGSLARFNLRTGRPELTAHLAAVPSLIAVDPEDETVWAIDAHGAATHVSPAGAALGPPVTLNAAPTGVAAGEGRWLWATAGGLVRVGGAGSPATFSVGPEPLGVALDQGVWTVHANGHVTRFDPRPGHLSVNTDVNVAPSLDAIAAVEGGSSVWTISKQTKTLYEISTGPGAPIMRRVVLSSAPVALAASDGGVWVATTDGSVTEIGS
jgi:streptogramin lyase